MSFTQLPDFLLDEGQLNVHELACAVFISRKTMGWGKRTDGISYSQFVNGLGISKPTVIKALKSLSDKGFITVLKGVNPNGSFTYNTYSFSDYVIDKSNDSRLLGGQSPLLGVVKEIDIQDKPITKQTRQEKAKLKDKEKSTASPGQPKAAANKLIIPDDLVDGLTKPALLEFIQHRKNKKAPLTQNALDRLIKTAVSCGDALAMTPDNVLAEVIDAGWTGVKLAWLQNRLGVSSGKNGVLGYEKNRQQFGKAGISDAERNAQEAREWASESGFLQR